MNNQEIVIMLFYILFGIIWGSYLNAVIYRMPLKRSASKGNSECMTCKHRLHAKDLIPVLSFLSTGGKCRYCKVRLSIQYPTIELLFGGIFAITYIYAGHNYYVTAIILIVSTLSIIMGVIDWKTSLMPNKTTIPFMLVGLFHAIAGNYFNLQKVNIYGERVGEDLLIVGPLKEILIMNAVIIVLVVIISLLNVGGIGGGDLKWLIGMALLMTPINGVYAFGAAGVMASIYALSVILTRKKKLNELHNYPAEVYNNDDILHHRYMGITKVNGKYGVVFGPALAITTILLLFSEFYI